MSKSHRAAQEASQRADEIHAQVYGTTVEDADPPANEEGDEVTAKADESPAEPEQKTEPEGSAPEPSATENWEQKYKTLQGMYNAEVPRLQGKLKKLQAEKEGLENVIATMSVAPEPPTQSGTQTRLVTDEEIQDWGPEMTDYFRRVAREQYDPIIEELRAENKKLQTQNLQLQKSVGTVEADRSAHGRTELLSALAQAVPDWAEINSADDFLEWLDHPDAFSGRNRNELLLEAYERNDTPRVIAFFQSFKRDKAVVSKDTPPSRVAEPTVRLESLVAPGKAPSTTMQPSSDTESNNRIWSQAEIQTFYRDVQRGKYRGKDAEKARIETAIVKAGREGRIK